MKNNTYITLNTNNPEEKRRIADIIPDFPYFEHLIKFNQISGEIRVHYGEDGVIPFKVSTIVDGKCLKEFRTHNPRYLKVFYDGIKADVCFYE